MVQQYYYKEYSAMKKRVDRFLRKSRRLQIVYKESDVQNDQIVYYLKFRRSLLNILVLRRIIRLSLLKVDGAVTRIEVGFMSEERQEVAGFRLKSTNKVLESLMHIF